MGAVTGFGLDQVLARHRVGIDAADFVAELDAELSRITSPAAAPLSEAERSFLLDHAGQHAAEVLRRDPDELAAEAARSAAAQLSGLLAQSLSIAEAALLLGVSRSRVSQRLSRGELWSFSLGHSRRLPRWQITPDGRPLPGLAEVIASIPRGLAPQTVAAFMDAPQDELGGVAPSVHLAGGGDVMPVADLLAALGQW